MNKTGSSNQTTRISCKGIGSAAAAQTVACALVVAEAKYRLRRKGMSIVDLRATNAVNIAGLCLVDSAYMDEKRFIVPSTSQLVYNANQVKLSSCSVLETSKVLAAEELESRLISNAMGTTSYMLDDICKSIVSELQFDKVWSTWVLIVYLCAHPRGRQILKNTKLTDVDIQAAVAFERYGSEEIRRRSRQRKTKDSVLSAKRKRGLRCTSVFGLSDAHCMLEFWHSALQSEDVSVLFTLAAHSKNTVKTAALSTLVRQTEGTQLSQNLIIQNLSMNNALKSAQTLVSFVGRKVEDIPSICMVRARHEHDGEYGVSCGFERTASEASNTFLFVCILPPRAMRPAVQCSMALAWSTASVKLRPQSGESATLPGVAERSYECLRTKEKNGRGKDVRDVASMKSYISSESNQAISACELGTTRSFISFATFMFFNQSHISASEKLVDEACAANLAASQLCQTGKDCFPRLLTKSRDDVMRSEPIPTPGSALAVGIGVNESLRRWMAGKTRRNEPCLKHVGFSASPEPLKDVPGIMSSEPTPLLTITDFGLERIEEPLSQDVNLAKTCVGLHVCGDAACRIPELLESMRSEACLDLYDLTIQSRSALLVASSQASFIGASLAGPLTAGYTNAAVASSKRILVPDVNKILFLSAYDCYAVGLTNVQRSFSGTNYSSTHGCRIDTGFTPSGISALNFKSDRRQHGNCTLSREVADEISAAFATKHWVVFKHPDSEKSVYCSIPVAARGIPHGFVPGLHSLTVPYCEMLETYRKVSGRSDSDTVDSIHVLPFSPFTQALAPDLEASCDASLRTCFRNSSGSSVCTGRAHLVDSTPEELAIAKEPLFRRPCQVSSGDNPFSTSYEAVDTFFNAANALALLAKTATRTFAPKADAVECCRNLHALTCSLFSETSGDKPSERAVVEAAWAADALTLLNCMYPTSLTVGEMALKSGISKASPFFQKLLHRKRPVAPDSLRISSIGLSDSEEDGVRKFWAAFCRENADTCAWSRGVCPLIELILKHDGSHSVDTTVACNFRKALENATRSAFLVHSRDGTSPPPKESPLAGVKSMKHICRSDVDPIFCGDADHDIIQRGALIGLKPHSYRQILAELMGSFLDGVVCNVAVNEGGLSLRVSSDATILSSNGKLRTDKSISPVQTETDESAFGTRPNKMIGAVLQKKGWDENARLGIPLFTSVEPPRSASVRSRGEYGLSDEFQTERAGLIENEQLPSERSALCRAEYMEAVLPVLAKLVDTKL